MKHTYHEYIEWVDGRIALYRRSLKLSQVLDDEFHGAVYKVLIGSLLANRAGLVRHKPKAVSWRDEVVTAVGCFECETYEPCPSLLDITNQLDLEMEE